jgi:ABC-type glycerol-3-phosphate transport system substrate-binding protein
MKIKKFSALLAAMLGVAAVMPGCTAKKDSETLELTVWNTQGTDYTYSSVEDSDLLAKWMKEKTGVEVVDIYGNDGGQWDVKLTRLVAGDNMPNLLVCGGFQGPAHFARLEQLGKAVELTPEMLRKYAPDLWARTPQKYWDKIKVNGKILGIPYKIPVEKASQPLASDSEIEFMKKISTPQVNVFSVNPVSIRYVRDDILKAVYPNVKTFSEIAGLLKEKQGPVGEDILDIPIYSTQDMIDFFYKVRDLNLKTENGKTVYAFGYDGGDNWEALASLGAEMYGYQGHFYTGTWNYKTQSVEIPLAGELVKKAAETQNKMVLDKVADPESLAHTFEMYREKIFNGQYAIPMNMDVSEINREYERLGKPYRMRPVYFQVPHDPDYPAYTEEQLWSESICLVNTLSGDDVIKTLKWINTQYTDEYEQVRNWGPEEAGLYTETSDGKRKFKNGDFNEYFIENDRTVLTEAKDRLGLQGRGGLWTVISNELSKWTPQVMYQKINYTPESAMSYRFPEGSEYCEGVMAFPPCQGWASIYADIPETVSFWGQRDQWENKVKMSLAAPAGEFGAKWAEAMETLNKAANIKVMEEKMTKVAREYLP